MRFQGASTRRPRTITIIRSLLVTIAWLLLSGCAAWNSIGQRSPADFISRERPREVRVTTRDTTLVLRRPVVQADSIVGTAKEPAPPHRVVIASADAQSLQCRGPSDSKTGKIIVGSVAAVVIAALVLAPRSRNIY